MVLTGSGSMFFLSWTIEYQQPKAIIYTAMKEDVLPIPWLYLPFPSYEEAWVFHQISANPMNSEFTCIPEINCLIPSKALVMNFNIAHAWQRGMALKMLWMGKDSRKRMGTFFIISDYVTSPHTTMSIRVCFSSINVGHIYIFPEIPGVLMCGPFPKAQIRSINDLNIEKLSNACKISSFIDNMISPEHRYMGDTHSWNSFFSSDLQKMELNNKNKVMACHVLLIIG